MALRVSGAFRAQAVIWSPCLFSYLRGSRYKHVTLHKWREQRQRPGRERATCAGLVVCLAADCRRSQRWRQVGGRRLTQRGNAMSVSMERDHGAKSGRRVRATAGPRGTSRGAMAQQGAPNSPQEGAGAQRGPEGPSAHPLSKQTRSGRVTLDHIREPCKQMRHLLGAHNGRRALICTPKPPPWLLLGLSPASRVPWPGALHRPCPVSSVHPHLRLHLHLACGLPAASTAFLPCPKLPAANPGTLPPTSTT